jgi:hypothetical protein
LPIHNHHSIVKGPLQNQNAKHVAPKGAVITLRELICSCGKALTRQEQVVTVLQLERSLQIVQKMKYSRWGVSCNPFVLKYARTDIAASKLAGCFFEVTSLPLKSICLFSEINAPHHNSEACK